MPAVYQHLGVRFLYPENWSVQDEEPDDWPRTVTLQSQHTSFWSLYVYPPGHEARAAVTEVIDSIRELYEDLEVLPAKETTVFLGEFEGQLRKILQLGGVTLVR